MEHPPAHVNLKFDALKLKFFALVYTTFVLQCVCFLAYGLTPLLATCIMNASQEDVFAPLFPRHPPFDATRSVVSALLGTMLVASLTFMFPVRHGTTHESVPQTLVSLPSVPRSRTAPSVVPGRQARGPWPRGTRGGPLIQNAPLAQQRTVDIPKGRSTVAASAPTQPQSSAALLRFGVHPTATWMALLGLVATCIAVVRTWRRSAPRQAGGMGARLCTDSVCAMMSAAPEQVIGTEGSAEDTIAAIATAVAAGSGSVAIVRVSGPAAVSIGQRMFRVAGKRQQWESHRVLYGHVIAPATGAIIDEALLLFMQAPRSFTAEDVVEFHCHGGLVVVQQVLQEALAAGARQALPGEFSQRAFLNGRLDLTQAEALADIMSARSRQGVQLALSGLDGGLGRAISELRGALLDQLAEMEARIDFEEDLPPLDACAVCAALRDIRKQLQVLIDDAAQGQLLRDGLRVAIVGPPNVGKSSLLNLLSRAERAIVTEVPGTTRDTVESELVMRGVPVTLIDTAGIRETEDPVERIGIVRSQEALQGADVVVQVFDLQRGWQDSDDHLAHTVPEGLPRVRVGNKVDVAPVSTVDTAAADVVISAATGQGLPDFEEALLRACGATETTGARAQLNRRQLDLAKRAVAALDQVLETAEEDLPWDFWTIDVRDAIQTLGEITGEEITEGTLHRIFSKFCIGK